MSFLRYSGSERQAKGRSDFAIACRDQPVHLLRRQISRQVGKPPMGIAILSEIFSIEARRAECGMIGADVRPNWSERGEPDRRASGDEARSPS